jgi:ubiquinone/menaquinone biosynthesis C-methylase UbiE
MDAEQLCFDDGSFDAALCALGLMYVPDPERAVREFFRVLRPGGRAAAAVWGQRNKCGWADIFRIVDARVRSDVCPLFFRLGTGQALYQGFASAGFANIAIRRIETQLQYRTADEACAAAFIGGPVALAYGHFSEETKAEARTEYLDSIEAYRMESGYSIVVAGTK